MGALIGDANVRGPAPLIAWGLAASVMPGESESGDLHVVVPVPDGVLVAVIDGLGHGPEAAAVAKIAASTLQANAHEPVTSVVRSCHEALRSTRGVVMTLASLNGAGETLTWLGVGNVEGLLLRNDAGASPARESLLLRAGVVGYHLPPLRSSVTSLAPGDTLVLVTDGINQGFAASLMRGDEPQGSAERILAEHYKGMDDGLVLVARYLGRAP